MGHPSRSLAVVVFIACHACAAQQQHAAQAPAPVAQTQPARAPTLGKPRADLIPREVLFGNPERSNVQISPDGKYLSWLAPSDGVMNVWVAPADKPEQANVVTADHTRPVREYKWTYDGEHLLYQQDKAGDENFHVYRARAAGGDVTDLTPLSGARAEIAGLSERKPNLVIVGLNDRDKEVFDIHQIDLRTGERKLLQKNEQKFVGYLLDSQLDVRLAQRMGEDGSALWFSLDPASKTWKPYDQTPADDVMTSMFLSFDRSGKHFFAMDSRGRNTGALVRVDAQTKRSSVLLEDARADLSQVLMHPVERTVQAALVNYDRPHWVALDKSVQPDLDALDKLEGSSGTPLIVSRTLDDRVWIVNLDSDRASARYYRWTRATQKADFLFSARPALDAQPLVKMRPLVIPARDGLPLVSYLSLPKDADANDDGVPETPLPMVLVVHGGPWARDEWGFDRLHQLLANRGYAALSVNFRGSTGFGKDYVNRGNKQWGKKMHEDLIDGVSWAIDKGITSKDKVCIMGGSYGGYATLAGLTLTPDTFACGVELVGPSNLITLLETIPPYWQPLMAMFHDRIGDPSTEQGKAALLEASPLTHAQNIQRPLLIGQGQNDPRVKKSESDQIVQALQAKHIPVGYVVFPDEGHGFARPENNIAFFAVAEAFLSVHLGGFYQPLTEAELAKSTLTIEAGRQTLPGLPERARPLALRDGQRRVSQLE